MSFVVASLAMKAVGLYRYLPIAHPESFVDVELPTPTASGRDVLVEVKAISVNPVDYKTRAPKDLVETTPKILGWDVAGVVKSAGGDDRLGKCGSALDGFDSPGPQPPRLAYVACDSLAEAPGRGAPPWHSDRCRSW